MKSAFFLVSLLLSASTAALAQAPAAGQPMPGDLTGARPSSTVAHATAPAAAAASDPVQEHLLGSNVNLAKVQAYQLPDLYERFITTTRDERRQWSYQSWEAASQVLARLNQRYTEVHAELPIEERLRIRAFQGEFRTLKGTRTLKEKLD